MAEKRGASQLARTMRSMIVIAIIGGGLAALNTINTRRDVGLATGPKGSAQLEFFAASATRPDLPLFYKALSPEQRLTMAKRLGEYDDPRVVSVVGKLLDTFDPAARVELSRSLDRLAKVQPDEVSSQLSLAGSFQFIAVSHALREVGAQAIPKVAERLSDSKTRDNALAFLVDSGREAIPSLEAKLDANDKDVRLAAADALGKLASRSSADKLVELYNKSTDTEKLAYLSALSSIGAPSTESLLTKALQDESLTIPQRSQAGLGLGRIGSATAVQTLSSFTGEADRQFQSSVYSALSLAGNTALESSSLSVSAKVRVASGIHSPVADRLIANALRDPALRDLAVRGLDGRPSLVAEIVNMAKASPNDEWADPLLRALSTTPEGKNELEQLQEDPVLGGLALRRLRLSNAS